MINIGRLYDEQQSNVIRAFFNDLKDIIWLGDDEYSELMKNKKVIRKKVKYYNSENYSYFFFKSKELKNKFIESNIHKLITEGRVHECHYSLGKFLGFPPKACENFPSTNTIGVDYCGVKFNSYANTIVYDVEWLLENKPIIEGEMVNIGDYSVEVGEDDWIEKLKVIALKYEQ